VAWVQHIKKMARAPAKKNCGAVQAFPETFRSLYGRAHPRATSARLIHNLP